MKDDQPAFEGETFLKRDRARMSVDIADSKFVNIMTARHCKGVTVFTDDKKGAFEVHAAHRDVRYAPGRVIYRYRLKGWAAAGEYGTAGSHAELEKELGERIRRKITEIVDSARAQGMDVLGIGEAFRRRGWNTDDWERRIKTLDIRFEVDVTVLSGLGKT